MQLDKFLYKQFTTNTGTHFLDSGGEDGRQWQRNKKRTLIDFLNEPQVSIDDWIIDNLKDGEDTSDIVPTVSTFHYMLNNLELDDICNKFNAIKCDNWNSDLAYGLSIEGEQFLEDNGLNIGEPFNSYNYESNLDHVLQGASVYTAGDALEYPTYIMLQLHLGADVRGGYTDAKLYKINTEYFSTNPSVYGDIDGVDVTTSYNGYNLTDDDGNAVSINKNSKINLFV